MLLWLGHVHHEKRGTTTAVLGGIAAVMAAVVVETWTVTAAVSSIDVVGTVSGAGEQ